MNTAPPVRNRVNRWREQGGLTDERDGLARKIARLSVHGLSDKEIAHHVQLSVGSIKAYFQDIRKAFDLKSKTAVAVWYRQKYPEDFA